jgi:Ca-activated chloride channel family protein
MGAKDMPTVDGKTDRISVTRNAVKTFSNRLVGDRLALVAFASEAYLVAPLTFDRQAVSGMIDELTIGLPGRKTDLGRAIGITVKLFQDREVSERFLIIISDGETNAGGLSAIDAARLAKELGIVIHMIGFAEKIEAASESHMQEIVALTGGIYQHARTPADLQAALHEVRQISLPARKTEPQFTVHDWTWLFLLLAFGVAAYIAWRRGRA